MTDTPQPTLSVDTIITGGTIYDGSGNPGFVGDVALGGGWILEVGDGLAGRYPSARRFDASGCAVAPGFIDIHTHSDLSVLANREMRSSIHQGVTTEMTGNCGISLGLVDGANPAFKQEQGWLEREKIAADWTSMGGFFERLESDGISCNLGTLIGHGTVRKAAMGYAERAPDTGELGVMRELVERGMLDGAFGLSTGLEYLPGGYAQLDEICSLAEVAKGYGGFYASHLRNEGDTLLEAMNEAIAVGERTGIAVQLSHHKAEGHANWGKVQTTLARMREARASGLDVLTDQYPYTAFMTGLTLILLPAWARNGSPEEMMERLAHPEQRARMEAEVMVGGLDFNAIRIGVARGNPQYQGLTLTELGEQMVKSPAAAAIDLLILENGWVAAAHFAISESDVEEVLRDEHTMIGSDGVTTTPAAPESPHPRSYGTFPRVLGRYVREKGVLSLPDAIRRMTSLPASRLMLSDRGRIAPGLRADLTIFRPDQIVDVATFASPHQYPSGIEYVFVNGALTIDRGQHTGARAGHVLRRPTPAL